MVIFHEKKTYDFEDLLGFRTFCEGGVGGGGRRDMGGGGMNPYPTQLDP